MKKFSALLFDLVFPLFAFAQTEFGSIQGRVADMDGEGIPGVTIAASSPSWIGRNAVAYTDKVGFYQIPALSPGVYEVKAELPAFQTVIRRDIRLYLGNTVTADFTLQAETVSETITVLGAPPLIDATTTAMSKTIPPEIVQNLPNALNRRESLGPGQEITALLSLTPGVGHDQVAYGATGPTANRIWIDGVDVSSPVGGVLFASMNYNWIDEVQVTGIGAPAEFGGFTGVVGNFVTRSGGNQFHGLFETFFQNEKLVSNNTSDPDLQSPFKSYNITAQLGGPILRGRLWFFSGFQYPYTQDRPFGYEGVITEEYPKFITKLTYKPNQNNTLQGFGNYNYRRLDGGNGSPGGFAFTPADASILPEATTVDTGNEASWNATWISLLSSQTTFEGRFGGFWAVSRQMPRNGDTPGHGDGITRVTSVNSIGHIESRRFRPQLNVSLSHYASDFLGSHDFKFGVQLERSDGRSTFGYNGGLYYYDLFGDLYLRYSTPDSNIDTSNHRISSYIQDNWSLSDRLTLGLGVRWDHNRGIADGETVFETDPVAPRVGLIWNSQGNGKSVVKAHYGDYYEALLTAQFDRLDDASFQESVKESFNPVTGRWDFVERIHFDAEAEGDRNRGHPFVRQFAIGIDQELPGTIALGAHYIHRRWKNILGLIDTSSKYEPVPFVNPLTGETITVFNLIQEGTEPLLLTNPPDQFRKYDSIEVVANRRFSEKLALSASFVYSRIEGNVRNSFETVNAGNNRVTDPNAAVNFTGRLINDPTVAWKIVGHWSLPWGINTGWFLWHESGDTWMPTVQVTGLNQGRVRILALPRGAKRLPSLSILDLRLEKQFPFYTGQLRVTADIFNVFNSGYITSVDDFYGSSAFRNPNFGQPTGFNEPRTISLGLRYTF